MKGTAAIWLISVGSLVGTASAARAQAYQPAEVVSAGDVYVPYAFVADGFFVLEARVDADGTLERIDALRDPGAMPGAAKDRMREWKFRPGREGGKAIASRITVSFLYPPTSYSTAAQPLDYAPVLPSDKQESRGYKPVGILAFAYPAYPVNSVAWGSVVIEVTVDGSGAVKGVEFLHRMGVFDPFALEALKKWRFRAATFNGRPIEAKTVIAFTFQPPPSRAR